MSHGADVSVRRRWDCVVYVERWVGGLACRQATRGPRAASDHDEAGECDAGPSRIWSNAEATARDPFAAPESAMSWTEVALAPRLGLSAREGCELVRSRASV